ncbi:hypothetical protein A8B82_09050 [Sulfitobacter sp. EhC04]|uniref:MarR family winged helix-turn-helix transcriptional regulator n=1 Tax=Sulfitobacter sp. EhC04 TaxID=1849168 RepID=UPI0007F34021|nr:MarR family winged helix-turn-helix transcriptional regulator [Sulfitobacter sp. EhC04]OAN78513.1 hypothetical protein A8B82_09050 [Sulfitobacter sp. EhC04]
MSNDFDTSGAFEVPRGKHPVVTGIEDVITFKLHTLEAIGGRSASGWSEELFQVSLTAWRVLAVVKSHQPVRAGDVADILLMDKSQLSRVIKQLTAKFLVVDTTDPHDGRAVALKLTSTGLALYDRVMAHVLDRNEKVLEPLSLAEVESFDMMLDKLIAHSRSMLASRS